MNYQLLLAQFKELNKDVEYDTSILANTSALLYHSLQDLNWCGFYLNENNTLLLGPFQGKTACTRIEYGKGVCGTAFKLKETVLVEDVHKFEGHIACDSASNSEIVVPIIINDKVFGVLDIDSPKLSRFTSEDKEGLEAIVKELEKLLENK